MYTRGAGARAERGAELQAEIGDAVGDGDRVGRGDGFEQRFGGLGLGVGGAGQAPDHGDGEAGIFAQQARGEEIAARGEVVLGVDRDARDERGRGAAPLGGREVRREVFADLALELGERAGEQATRGGDVAPDERLAIGEEQVVGLEDDVGRGGAAR
ncbi:hypothetical protein [Polyangium mundeleinium]|uniref:Uncharacterized protein n=1 Tax=Polyangium mundeleinium TaxID=2995306 RepID=A0ABT5ESC4_9BACT|nr:hypothetical protein [Polyangium mundeleinium]MDC0744262.1 hypothetical protein [Polyangium mundeleinium]